MYKLSRQAKILVLSLLVIAGLGGFFFWHLNRNGSTLADSFVGQSGNEMQLSVAEAQAKTDPNHPVEVYFGSPQFKDLTSMLKDLAVTIYPEDRVFTFPPPDMGLGSRITIVRATPVQLTDAKTLTVYRTWELSVGKLLTEQNISLIGKDSVNPSLDSPISYNLAVKITRVAEVELTQTESMDFPTINKNSRDLERGQTQISQKGVKGQKTVTYMVKRVDGMEVSRTVENTKVITAPTAQITIIGTGPKQVHSGAYMDTLNAAAIKYNIDAPALQCLMLRESNGHNTSVASAGYEGLFQYDPGFWASASANAGYGGADWSNPQAQIFTTAYEITHGAGGRWPTWAGCAGK
jgi:hypothetical protein